MSFMSGCCRGSSWRRRPTGVAVSIARPAPTASPASSATTRARCRKENGVYAFVLEGDVEIADAILTRRDSLALEGEGKLEIKVRTAGTDILLVETKL